MARSFLSPSLRVTSIRAFLARSMVLWGPTCTIHQLLPAASTNLDVDVLEPLAEAIAEKSLAPSRFSNCPTTRQSGCDCAVSTGMRNRPVARTKRFAVRTTTVFLEGMNRTWKMEFGWVGWRL